MSYIFSDQNRMQTLNTEYKPMQHEELIISAASKTSVTGACAAVVGTVSQVDIMTLTDDYAVELVIALAENDVEEVQKQVKALAGKYIPKQ